MVFSLDELDELRERAEKAAVSKGLGPSLATAYMRFYEAVDALHALTLRETPPEELLRRLLGPQEGAEGEEAPDTPPDETEPPEPGQRGPRDKELDAIERPVFRVRPKAKSKRICSVCGEPQWLSKSGWTCDNGHGDAPPRR